MKPFTTHQGAADKIRHAMRPAVDCINRITKPITGSGFARLVRVGNETRRSRPVHWPLPEKYTRGK